MNEEFGNTVAQEVRIATAELRFDSCRQGKCLLDTDSSRSPELNGSAPDNAGRDYGLQFLQSNELRRCTKKRTYKVGDTPK